MRKSLTAAALTAGIILTGATAASAAGSPAECRAAATLLAKADAIQDNAPASAAQLRLAAAQLCTL